jgi:hypothetical protein
MKHLKYILVPALTGLLFAACNTAPQGPSQAELDTQVAAKVKSATELLKSECDNRINTAAQIKSDSIVAIAAKRKAAKPAPVAAKPKPTPAVVTKPTPEQSLW